MHQIFLVNCDTSSLEIYMAICIRACSFNSSLGLSRNFSFPVFIAYGDSEAVAGANLRALFGNRIFPSPLMTLKIPFFAKLWNIANAISLLTSSSLPEHCSQNHYHAYMTSFTSKAPSYHLKEKLDSHKHVASPFSIKVLQEWFSFSDINWHIQFDKIKQVIFLKPHQVIYQNGES